MVINHSKMGSRRGGVRGGGGRRGSRVGQRGMGQGFEEERRSLERKMDSGCSSRGSEWPRYLLTLSSFPTLLDAS